MNKLGLGVVLLVLALAAAVSLWESPQDILRPSKAAAPREAIPFAVARNATTTYYDKDGAVSYQFTADKLEHFRELDTRGEATRYTLVSAPQLVIMDEDQPWTVTARNGKILHAQNLLTLWDEVRIDHTDNENGSVQMTTERLDIYPSKKFAETDQPVKIRSQIGELNAVGMGADLSKQKIHLRSQVQGHHDPS